MRKMLGNIVKISKNIRKKLYITTNPYKIRKYAENALISAIFEIIRDITPSCKIILKKWREF